MLITKSEEHRFLELMKDLIEYNSCDYDDELASEVKKYNYDVLREIFCGIEFEEGDR